MRYLPRHKQECARFEAEAEAEEKAEAEAAELQAKAEEERDAGGMDGGKGGSGGAGSGGGGGKKKGRGKKKKEWIPEHIKQELPYGIKMILLPSRPPQEMRLPPAQWPPPRLVPLSQSLCCRQKAIQVTVAPPSYKHTVVPHCR